MAADNVASFMAARGMITGPAGIAWRARERLGSGADVSDGHRDAGGRVRHGGPGGPARTGVPPGVGGGMVPAGSGRALGRAMLYLCSYRLETFGALMALLVTSASILAAPQLIRYAVDVGLGERRLDVLFLAVGGLVAVAAVRGVFTFFQGYLAEREIGRASCRERV